MNGRETTADMETGAGTGTGDEVLEFESLEMDPVKDVMT